ncbi:MAG: GreA/GreB family elongation factor [Clostridia bacterium]|nr:GreA/GreB family elongation factor [Clostridia bacterium]
MHDELTKVDIEQMRKELAERKLLTAELREEVGRTRAYGDLSENDEYRCAKREFNKNLSRIRYLENMIKTAVIISVDSKEDEVGLFDKVEIYYPEDDEKRTVRIVTTLRNDVFSDNISKESPFGKALLGRHAGETVTIHVNDKVSYPVKILSITKGQDDPNLPISSY